MTPIYLPVLNQEGSKVFRWIIMCWRVLVVFPPARFFVKSEIYHERGMQSQISVVT